MKKIYFTLGILLLGTVTMAYVYFTSINKDQNANNLSLNAVVKNAGLVFSFENDKSFYEILSGQELFQQVLGTAKSQLLKNMKDHLIGEPAIFNEIDGQKTYIGFSGDSTAINFLVTTQLKEELKISDVTKQLTIKRITLKPNGKTYQLTFPDQSILYLLIRQKLVVLSSNEALVLKASNEQAVDQEFANFIKTNTRTNKNTLANLYVNFNAFPGLLSSVVNSKMTGELNIFNQQNSYAALSYSFSKEKLLFNGTTVINDANNYFYLFTDIPAQKIVIDRILPAKTANYIAYIVSDYSAWQKQLNTWLASQKGNVNGKSHLEKINQQYRVNLQEIIPRYFKHQLITFQLNTGEKFGAIELTNGEKTNQLLLDLSAEYATGIRILKEPYLPYLFFGEPFKKFERPFYTIIDNHLIMANNASSIASFLSSYNSNSLLINEQHYLKLGDQLSSSATIAFYVNHRNSNDILGKNLKMPFYKHHLAAEGLNSFTAFSYQLTSDKGKFLSNVLLYKDLEKKIEQDSTTTIPKI